MKRALTLLLFLATSLVFSQAAMAASALVGAAWLKARLPHLAVLDIRPEGAFANAHIPGARNIPFSASLWRETRHGIPGYMPTARKLAAELGSRGITRQTALVIVSSGKDLRAVARAARIFWIFRRLGHENLHLLDGGMRAWRALPGPLRKSTDLSVNQAQRHYIPRPDVSILATLEQTQDALDNNVPPIDAREMDWFFGYRNALDEEDGGTIFDAVNVPASELLDKDTLRFLSPHALRGVFASRRIVLDEGKLVTFSTHGVMAAVDWFALHEILHLPDVRLYDGSLAEWAAEGMDLYDSTDGMGGIIGG